MYGDSIDEDNQRVRHRSDANGAASSSGELLLPASVTSPDWSRARPHPACPNSSMHCFRWAQRCSECSISRRNYLHTIVYGTSHHGPTAIGTCLEGTDLSSVCDSMLSRAVAAMLPQVAGRESQR